MACTLVVGEGPVRPFPCAGTCAGIHYRKPLKKKKEKKKELAQEYINANDAMHLIKIG